MGTVILTRAARRLAKILHTLGAIGFMGGMAALLALAPYGVEPDMIPAAFNVFMNVPVDGTTGALKVEAPLSKAGDHVTFLAEEDLVIGLTACSALQSNNYSFKPIDYVVT